MKTIGYLVVTLLVAILLTMTNPTTDDFAAHMKSVEAESGNSAPSNPVSGMMDAFSSWLTAEYARQNAHRDDYVIFSLYTVEGDGEKERWVGILKRFFHLPS